MGSKQVKSSRTIAPSHYAKRRCLITGKMVDDVPPLVGEARLNKRQKEARVAVLEADMAGMRRIYAEKPWSERAMMTREVADYKRKQREYMTLTGEITPPIYADI